MEMAGLATEATTNDLDLMRGVIRKIDSEGEGPLVQSIEDGYYALTDNLPNLINDIQKAIKIHAKSLPVDMEEIKALRNELKIYNDIRTLIDESTFGALL
jgi:iron-sulfur cluster repair protein YtfE (RIC family)